MKSSRPAVRRQAKRLFRLCMADGVLDEDRLREVVKRVIDSARRDAPALLAQLKRLVKNHVAGKTAIVESAAPLPGDLRASLESLLEQAYARPVATSFVNQPDLIGGLRIRIAYDLFDGTVLRALKTLEASF